MPIENHKRFFEIVASQQFIAAAAEQMIKSQTT
jgi:hypothetical protein